MNLDLILNNTKQYWDIHYKWSIFHQLISLIISQRIRFSLGRQIRQNLYKHLNLPNGNSLIPLQIRTLSDIDYKNIKMPADKIKIIHNVLDAIKDDEWDQDFELLLTKLEKINGIGSWTISALKIMFYADKYPNILLISDYWVKSRLSELKPEFKNYINAHNQINLSNISKFLWRIKPIGIQKLNNNIEISNEDFL